MGCLGERWVRFAFPPCEGRLVGERWVRCAYPPYIGRLVGERWVRFAYPPYIGRLVGERWVRCAYPPYNDSPFSMHCRAGKRMRTRHVNPPDYSFANTRRAASMVLLISSSLCATDIKPASNADGAKYTPSSSIRWKKRLKRSTSHFTTS